MTQNQPLIPYDDRPGDDSRDFAAAGKFSLFALERMLQSCRHQPNNWRALATVCASYYDGDQLSRAQSETLRSEGLEERAINLTRPIINSVLGQEAKTRTDVRLEADDESYADVAEAISQKLKEAERETNAHMGVSDGYASMVKKALGWVHVCRNSDPLAYPYLVESVAMEDVWWDYSGQRGVTLTDSCRWLVRKRFIDLDELCAAMPEHAEVLKNSVNGWSGWLDQTGNLLGEPNEALMQDAYNNERRFSTTVNRSDWVDTARKMVKMYEVWYRVPAQCVVLHMSPTKTVQYDPKDQRHVEAVSRGLVKLSKGSTSQVRRALYAGPHRLIDEATTRRKFPYIPFFAFRKDIDRSPYGLIQGMIAPQDEYNELSHRIQWMRKAKQIHMDSDALDTKYNTIADIEATAMRADMVAITNPLRQNRGEALKIKNELGLQPEQFNMLANSKQLMQDTAGRFASQMGSAGVQSGVANSLLIEQGDQSTGEMNDNYIFARRAVFESLVGLIIEDHRDERISVPVGSGKSRRVIVLNDRDAQGMPVNQVKDADIKTALSEVQSTPAYRQQQQQQIATVLTAMGSNPQAVAILAPLYLENSGIVNRQQAADDLRRAAGVPASDDKQGRDAAQAAQEQQQAAQQQQQQAAAQQQQALAAALLEEKAANTARYQATTRQANANAALIEQRIEAGAAPADVDHTVAETERLRAESVNHDQLMNDAMAEALN